MRFSFGKNWKSFCKTITTDMIIEAQRAIESSFCDINLRGKRVLDIGSGSGLSSLAFLQLGANVTAFDYDRDSVECTEALLASKAESDAEWRVMQGSVLDSTFMASIGTFDIVYSWGVLHHTGAMWQAMDNTASAVKDDGILLIALYNDQGLLSKLWKAVKWTYCTGWPGRIMVKAAFYPVFFAYSIFQDFKNRQAPMSHIRGYHLNRGMSILHDWDDWLGGYPFEVASESAVMEWANKHGMTVLNTQSTSGLGCNEFVFRKN